MQYLANCVNDKTVDLTFGLKFFGSKYDAITRSKLSISKPFSGLITDLLKRLYTWFLSLQSICGLGNGVSGRGGGHPRQGMFSNWQMYCWV